VLEEREREDDLDDEREEVEEEADLDEEREDVLSDRAGVDVLEAD
jgi:hypothetical protein